MTRGLLITTRSTHMYTLNEALARERTSEWRRQAQRDHRAHELAAERRWRRLERKANSARDRSS